MHIQSGGDDLGVVEEENAPPIKDPGKFRKNPIVDAVCASIPCTITLCRCTPCTGTPCASIPCTLNSVTLCAYTINSDTINSDTINSDTINSGTPYTLSSCNQEARRGSVSEGIGRNARIRKFIGEIAYF
jgi:hypothetical protein